ncbi:MAG: DUF1700 domain-containing protein [Eisenbergiella sp.]
MSRKEFMQRLEALLSDLSENEREEALQYYNGYLDDAGSENEEEVLQELGTPEALAASIRQGLKEDGIGNGYFSENGFYEKEPQRERPSSREAAEEKKETLNDRYRSGKKSKTSGGTIALFVILCIFAAPIVVPVVISLLAVIFALTLTAVILLCVMFLWSRMRGGRSMPLIGSVLDAVTFPAGAVLGIGMSLVTIGGGILCVLLFGWLIVKGCPRVFRSTVNMCSRLLHRKGNEKDE